MRWPTKYRKTLPSLDLFHMCKQFGSLRWNHRSQALYSFLLFFFLKLNMLKAEFLKEESSLKSTVYAKKFTQKNFFIVEIIGNTLLTTFKRRIFLIVTLISFFLELGNFFFFQSGNDFTRFPTRSAYPLSKNPWNLRENFCYLQFATMKTF